MGGRRSRGRNACATGGRRGERDAGTSAAGGGEADVVDFGVGAPFGAGGDGDFEFAREIVELRIAAEFFVEGKGEWGDVGDFVGVNPGERATGDVAGDVAAGTGGAEADGPEALENFRKIFDGDPVELNVLPDGDVGESIAKIFGNVGDGAGLFAGEQAIGDANTDHEVGDRLPFPALATGDAVAVALGVNAPGTEIGAEPFGRNRVKTFRGEGTDFVEMLPGIFFAFETFDALGFCFFYVGHLVMDLMFTIAFLQELLASLPLSELAEGGLNL